MNKANQEELSQLADSVLLAKLQAGQDDAATALYDRYAHRLIRLADQRSGDKLSTRVDAEDIVQSVFRTFFRRASAGHYHVPDGEELWKLFLVISLNKIRKKAEYHQAAKRDMGRTEALGDKPVCAPDQPTEVLRITVEDLVARLPKPHQGVIWDRIKGYDVNEMAERNELSRRTVERILQVFRKSLQDELNL